VFNFSSIGFRASFILVLLFFSLFYGAKGSAQENAQITNLTAPSSCSFSGDFEQNKALKGLENTIESTGIFFFHCELGVIWKTLTPVQETLVLNKMGASSRVEEGQVSSFGSRQGRLLGKLINGLMGADAEFIDENFEVQSTKIEVPSNDSAQYFHRQSHVLNPKKSRLRRAIKRIELVTPLQTVNRQNSERNDNGVTISILDRNNQWTHIVTSGTLDYQVTGSELKPCLSSERFSDLECKLLEQSHDN
jgi:hypothetical protein